MDPVRDENMNKTVTYAGNMGNLDHAQATRELPPLNKALFGYGPDQNTTDPTQPDFIDTFDEADVIRLFGFDDGVELIEPVRRPNTYKPPDEEAGTSSQASTSQASDDETEVDVATGSASASNNDSSVPSDNTDGGSGPSANVDPSNFANDTANRDAQFPNISNDDQRASGTSFNVTSGAGPSAIDDFLSFSNLDLTKNVNGSRGLKKYMNKTFSAGLLKFEDDMLDARKISKLFTINFSAFRASYRRRDSDTDDDSEARPSRFVLENVEDIKTFMRHLLKIYNVNERDLILNVEVSALLMHAVLCTHSHKSHILKMMLALLTNNMRQVFRLVDESGSDVYGRVDDTSDDEALNPEQGARPELDEQTEQSNQSEERE